MKNGLSLQKLKVLTYPLTSYYAYSNPDFLNSQNQAKLEYDIIFEEIRQGFYTTKLDSVKMLINKHWEIGETLLTEDILCKLNSQIGRKYLHVKDGKIYMSSPCHDEDNMKEMVIGQSYSQKIEWNLLNHLLNMDSVIGAYFIENSFVSNTDMLLWDASIFTTNSLLDKMLEKGMADIHMHAGAARKFSHIWLSLMNSLENDKMFNTIKIKTYNGYVIFSMYIKVVAVLRLLMAIYLSKEHDTNFKQFVQSLLPVTKDASDGALEKICDLLHNGAELHGNDTIDFNIKELFDQVVKASGITKKDVKTDNYKDEVLSNDILSFVFTRNFIYDEELKEFIIKGVDTGFVLPEHVLVKSCIERLDKGDAYFNRLFWQYTRIKNIFYAYVVQQHTSGKGLDVFVPIYGRQGAINNPHITSEAFYSQMNNQNIVKLELRVSPRDTEEELKKSVSDILKQYKDLLQNEYNPLKKEKIPFKSNRFPLLGIVFHFIKKIDTYNDKCYYLYSQEKKDNYISYGNLMETYKNQAKLIAKLRKEIPYISNYIVGIDAASKENNTEPYVLREAYEILRNQQNIELTDDVGGYYIKTIGYTYHVGEDFRDVISGLRHVDEVIEEFKFTAGDRLGHAIVIGIDIEKWAEMNSTVYLPAGEYFENLLWEWGVYTKDDTYKDIENIRFLENRIFEVAEFIFGSVDGMSVRELYSNYKWKFKSAYLSEMHYDGDCMLKEFAGIKCILQAPTVSEVLEENNKMVWTSQHIRHAMNCRYFLKKIEKTIEVNISRQLIEKYKKIQAYMKGKISEKGLVIEANPTSNLIIGDFATFEDYHITNLSSPEKEDVIITINTDDPVIFNTNLSNEFSLIFDIMVKSGKYSSKDIIQWLDKIRDNGVNYSFIPDRWLTRDEIIKEVDTILGWLEIG